MWDVTAEILDALEIGAGILGTGGGGNPYLGKIEALQQLKAGKIIQVVSIDEIGDDAFVTTVGPTSSTKMECRANLCGDRQLSCTCASSACAGFGAGLCSVRDDRLTCDDGRQ